MKLVSVALLFLGSLTFLSADTARHDVASEFGKKWNKWSLSRGKRELQVSSSYPSELADTTAGPAHTAAVPQDVKSVSGGPQASGQDAVRIRVKRYRQTKSSFQGLRGAGCRFGTCTVQKLAHQIYQFTDKDKDGTAPRSKISPQGYGRRRRSLREAGRGRTLVSTEPRPLTAQGSRGHKALAPLLKI
ncbi:pro-adrenomedullin [Ctenodactylus gundi]